MRRSEHAHRRQFLKSTAQGAGALASMAWGGRALGMPAVSARQARVQPGLVRLADDIEPLVQLIEETDRDKLIESVASEIRGGRSFREVVAALFLATVRNVQSRPSVGFKFHAVLVVNSALLASLSGPDEDRWLPILWAIDEFKVSQADEQKRGAWRMPPVDEKALPPAHQARTAFIQAMETWDEPGADAAAAALARSAGANEIFDLFCRFGARDFRSIGHKIIYVSNSWRTLQFIGWEHAEPVLRSLAFALLNHDIQGATPDKREDSADLPGRRNVELASKLDPHWVCGKVDAGATRELLETLRTANHDAVCDAALAQLSSGVAAQSVLDALFVGAGELLVRQPGIVALHAVTSTNALRYAFSNCGEEATRPWLLLQNCAFLPMFREAMAGRGAVAKTRIDDLTPLATKAESADQAIDEILHDVSGARVQAARKVRHFLGAGGSSRDLINASRRLLFAKGRNHHDYKFTSAVLEDYQHVSPAWRDPFLATSVFNLRGSRDRDNGLIGRIREAMKG